LIVLQQVNDASRDMNIALFDKDGVSDRFSAYAEEFSFIVQGNSDTKMTPLNLARNRLAEGGRALQLAGPYNNARLNESIFGSITPLRTDFSNVGSAFRGWVEDCKRRIDTVRGSLR
jgi:hypothetical protein